MGCPSGIEGACSPDPHADSADQADEKDDLVGEKVLATSD